MASPTPYQSENNEIANAITHGIGFIGSVAGLVALALLNVGQELGTVGVAGLMIYAMSLISVYALSTLSHIVREPKTKHWFRALDQGAIYLLISGTYTPLVIRYVPGALMWLTLLLIWLAAFAGCYLKVAVHHRVDSTVVWSYLALGWLPVLAFIGHFPPLEVFGWMALGGVSYSVGTIFLKYDQGINYLHAIWHVWVMIGSACHFYAIYRYAA